MNPLAQRSSSSLANTVHHAWPSSMPNSDLWTLKSTIVAASATPNLRQVTRRVVAVKTPIMHTARIEGNIEVNIPPPQLYTVSRAAFSSSTAFSQPPTYHTIGQGHPSTPSGRTASPASQSLKPAPLPRINSSTIKHRTKPFPRRDLSVIHEHPSGDSFPDSLQTFNSNSSAQVAGASPEQGTDRLVALAHGSGEAVSYAGSTPAPRFTSLGTAHAGPKQVQSPRVLLPATMAGSPWFQSLDGAVCDIRQRVVAAGPVKEETAVEETAVEEEAAELYYTVDTLMKWKFRVGMRIRHMLGRWMVPEF